MLGFFELLLQVVLSGIIFGGVAAVVFLKICDRWMARVKGTAGRTYGELGDFETGAHPRSEEPVTGGAIGYRYFQHGADTVRIQPTGTGHLVLRRCGELPLARFLVDDEARALELFDLLSRQIVEEEAHGPAAGVYFKGKRVLSKCRAGARRLALLQSDDLLKVTDMRGPTLCGAGIVANDRHGRELLELLASPPSAASAAHAVEAAPAGARHVRDEPGQGGRLDEIDLERREAAPHYEPPELDDPDWDRLFR